MAGIWSDPARARRVVEQARVFAEDNFQLGRKMDETLRAYEVAIEAQARALRRVRRYEKAGLDGGSRLLPLGASVPWEAGARAGIRR